MNFKVWWYIWIEFVAIKYVLNKWYVLLDGFFDLSVYLTISVLIFFRD